MRETQKYDGIFDRSGKYQCEYSWRKHCDDVCSDYEEEVELQEADQTIEPEDEDIILDKDSYRPFTLLIS